MKHLLILIIPIFFMSCKSTEAQTVEQGIKGQVKWYEGNLMPGPDNKATQGEAVQREVHIYELVSINNMPRQGELYEEMPSKLVKKVTTDENGNFSVALSPGQYSVFTKEDEGLFASISDGEGNINPVTVQEGEVTEIKIDINYKAYY